VPTRGDMLGQRTLDAALCWGLVNLMSESAVAAVCGAGRNSAVARSALFAGEGRA
jgi:hypothetical protein